MNRNFEKLIITFTTMLATMMQAVDTSVANVALPHMQGTFSAALDDITWVLTSYLVANAIVVPITGWMGTFFGRRRIYILSLVVFSLASLGSGAAPSLAFCVVMRVFQGFSGGVIVPMSQAILLEAFPEEERGRALSYFGVGVVFGPILGPILGGWITDNWSWRWIFYINIPIGVLAVILALAFVWDPPYLKRPKGGLDAWSLAFVILGLGGLEVVLSRGERLDWFQSNFITIFSLVALLGIVLFVWRSVTHVNPLVDLSILKNREFAAGVGLSFFQYFVLYSTLVMLPLFVQNLLGYTATWAGLLLAPGGAAALLAMLVGGQITGRIDPRWLLLAGVLIMIFSLRMLWSLYLGIDFAYLATARFIQGFGVGLLFISVAAAAYSTMPASKMGYATGFYNLVRNEAGSVGIAVASTLLARRAQFHQERLIEHLNPFNPVYRERLVEGAHAVLSHPGSNLQSADPITRSLLYHQVHAQALVLSYADIFWVITYVMLAFLLLIPLLRGKIIKAAAHEPQNPGKQQETGEERVRKKAGGREKTISPGESP